jgi:hypothetical protein
VVMLGIALFFGVILCGLALRANSRFRDEDRLPMQWWLTGEVTWTAPRVVALAFVPALAIVILTINAALALNLQPRPGQEGLVLPATIATGIIFIGVQLFHFWLMENTLHRNGS